MTGQLLRYRSGRPITYRRYDHLWHRIGEHLPWVATQQISTHWLRHTTLTWVERNFGYATARAYAGHNDTGTLRFPLSTVALAGIGEFLIGYDVSGSPSILNLLWWWAQQWQPTGALQVISVGGRVDAASVGVGIALLLVHRPWHRLRDQPRRWPGWSRRR